jgi:hypothetical protein
MNRRKNDGKRGGSEATNADPASIYVNADHLRKGFYWRIDDYGAAGALDGGARETLEQKLGFSKDQAAELSLFLGFALDRQSEGRLLETDPMRLEQKARQAMKDEIETLMDAATLLTDGITKLDSLDTSASLNAKWAERFDAVRADWDQAIRDLEDVHRRLEFIANEHGVAFHVASLDRRKVPDVRRETVLETLFEFWERSGRTLSYTTDPITNVQSGELIEFVQLTVSFLLDPAPEGANADEEILEDSLEDEPAPLDHPNKPIPILPTTTIVRDLRRFKTKNKNALGS